MIFHGLKKIMTPLAWENTLFHMGLGIACFYGLGDYPLLDNNEGLYSAIARDMALSGQWIIPHLNGVPYVEKPPLLYWLTALSFRLWGVSAWSARCVPACAAYAMVWRLTVFCRYHIPGHSRFLGWMMASTLGFWVWSRMVFFDMVMTFWLTQSLLFFYTFWASRRRADIRWSWVCLAGGVMTKGFVVLILWGIVVGSFLLWDLRHTFKTRGRSIFDSADPQGIALFLMLVVPWHILAHLQDPHFSFFYFINEHVLRFLDLRKPKDYYTGPCYYHIPRVFIMTFPWWGIGIKIIAEGVMSAIKQWRQSHHQGALSSPLKVFALIWFLSILIFFSVSRAKANYYMLASLPAVFVMLSVFCGARIPWGVWITGTASIMGIWLKYGLFARDIDAFALQEHTVQLPFQSTILAWIGLIVSSFLGILLVRKKNTLGAMAYFGGIVWAFWIGWMPLLTYNTALYSSQSIVQYLPQKQSCFLFQDFEDVSSLAFYHPQPWVILDSQSRDLLYGQTHAPQNFFMTMQHFNTRSQQDWVVIKNTKCTTFFSVCRRPGTLVTRTPFLSVYVFRAS